MALVASELGSALPGEGGFYLWARRGLGDFWGFQTAWWWSLSIFVDSSVYIVLAVGYLQNWLHFNQLWFYVICWAIIAAFTIMNIVGVQIIALSSTLFAVIIIAPSWRSSWSGWRSGSSIRSRRSRRRACRSSAPAAPSALAWPSASGCTPAMSRCPRCRRDP